MPIKKLIHIRNLNLDEFMDELCKSIGELQSDGFKVDIQYSVGIDGYNALLIVKKDDCYYS